MTDNEIKEQLREMVPATLYDVFYETNTILSGTMIALERFYREHGNIAAADNIRKENMSIIDEREAVSPDDMETQIECDIKWSHRTDELNALLDSLEQAK